MRHRIVALVFGLVCSTSVRGQSAPAPFDSASVARFVAEFMGGLHGDSVARAAVVVVTSRGVLLSRGFGQHGVVDPRRLFSRRSNSKGSRLRRRCS
jgi:hypothetical protein